MWDGADRTLWAAKLYPACDTIREAVAAEAYETAAELRDEIREQLEITVKYEGYIKHQLEEVARQQKSETTRLPDDVDYMTIKGLRTEAAQKLNAVKPATVGQAARISGVNPADVSVLLIWMQMKR